MTFAEESKVKPIILGGRDAWQIAAYLKQHDVPVLLTSVMELPSREDDPYDVNYGAPAKLAAAGVRFAITSGDAGSEVRNLPYTAGMAAALSVLFRCDTSTLGMNTRALSSAVMSAMLGSELTRWRERRRT